MGTLRSKKKVSGQRRVSKGIRHGYFSPVTSWVTFPGNPENIRLAPLHLQPNVFDRLLGTYLTIFAVEWVPRSKSTPDKIIRDLIAIKSACLAYTINESFILTTADTSNV